MHAHYILACTDPYLAQIWSDQRYQGIDGIRGPGTCRTYMRVLCDPCTQASLHACYILACTDPYLGFIWLDQMDQCPDLL